MKSFTTSMGWIIMLENRFHFFYLSGRYFINAYLILYIILWKIIFAIILLSHQKKILHKFNRTFMFALQKHKCLSTDIYIIVEPFCLELWWIDPCLLELGWVEPCYLQFEWVKSVIWNSNESYIVMVHFDRLDRRYYEIKWVEACYLKFGWVEPGYHELG